MVTVHKSCTVANDLECLFCASYLGTFFTNAVKVCIRIFGENCPLNCWCSTPARVQHALGCLGSHDIMTCRYFAWHHNMESHCWPFGRGIHRSTLICPYKGTVARNIGFPKFLYWSPEQFDVAKQRQVLIIASIIEFNLSLNVIKLCNQENVT